ncbi:metallophosphoesterase [Algibacillus agarilyticus]|uniref:metallophosphoesterase n=1 Tax=Algibacillus agarilyticus TaxID=2234133 RepID=UPI000DD06B08|nr:metallophosphoesterase [Algibacillus agarilyticus]
MTLATYLPHLATFNPALCLTGDLPSKIESWDLTQVHSANVETEQESNFSDLMNKTVSYKPWKAPNKQVLFISDPHADADGFVASLVASGGATKTGAGYLDFKLTKIGKKSVFVIGGDCLDKGPSNLNLLRAIKKLFDLGAKVKLIAGNHDMRLLLGLRAISTPKDVTSEHFFIRMGTKVIPLLKEVQQEFVTDTDYEQITLTEQECKAELFPRDNWCEAFSEAVKTRLSGKAIENEIKKTSKKINGFEASCAKYDLTMRDVYVIAQKCQQLFLTKSGEFSWFFKKMQLIYKQASFVFVHAGLDDKISKLIDKKGIKKINKMYQKQTQSDLFTFYYGVVANVLRTKYRDADFSLSEKGVNRLHRQGIHVIVQGHVNRKQGQRLAFKKGLLHVEGDITIDRHSRQKEGLEGVGAGATIIRPEGHVVGISNDYPYAKVFEPKLYLEGKYAS